MKRAYRRAKSLKDVSLKIILELFSMNDEHILNEQIDVVALFRPGRTMCEPIKLRRKNGREIVVTEIGLRHPRTHGSRTVHVFDVTDGGADYRLEFDAEHLTWRLIWEADTW